MFSIINSFFAKFTWFEPYKDIRNFLAKENNRTIELESLILSAKNPQLHEIYDLYYNQGLSNYKIADELNINIRNLNHRKRELYAFVDGLKRTV